MTYRQLQYLVTLAGNGKNQQTLSSVARLYGVNRSTVSRAMTGMISEGILDSDYNLTVFGRRYLDEYKSRFEYICDLLESGGIDEEAAKKDAHGIMECCSGDTIKLLENMGHIKRVMSDMNCDDNGALHGSDLSRYMQEGEYKVPFTLTKVKRKEKESSLSMANAGFLHPALLEVRKDTSYLCLTVCDIKKKPAGKKSEISGRVSSLKYTRDGKSENAIFAEDKIYIPGEAFKYVYVKEDNFLYASLRLTINVSVEHMPESAADLIFFLR